MWISNILFRRHVPGRIFSGKHRVTMKVTRLQRNRKKENDLRVENNKAFLSYPYLTVCEEKSHATSRNVEQRNSFFDIARKRRNLGNPILNTTTSNVKGFLEHLNVTKT